MIQSMTGFGKAVVELPHKKITVEIKSLNSKQLDLSTRIPQQYREMEMEIRSEIAKRLERGKVDFFVYSEAIGKEASAQINIPVLEGYFQQVKEASIKLGIAMPDDWFSILLRLPDVVRELSEMPRGLVLVTGPTGSGKSTTLASMVDHINKTTSRHILTIEDPIEYVYPHNRAMIHQREVGKDVSSFASALRSALREDPDIILVGEMRDFETISAAISAAETGHLVLSTLHTTSAAQTVERIIDACPIDGQAQIRSQFANVIRGVITQQLLPLADGSGRVIATEIMIANVAISNLIRENKTIQIPSMLQSGRKEGMHSLNDDLIALVNDGKVTRDEALKVSSDPASLEKVLY